MSYTETNMAYIAGFLDADGSIGLNKASNSRTIRPVITFANTKVEVLSFIKDKLELSTSITCITRDKKQKRVPIYTIHIGKASEVTRVLMQVKEYLTIKKERALLVLEFLRLKTSKQGVRNYTFSERELEITEIMKILNKRGL